MDNNQKSFNHNRLEFARKRRGITRKKLADKLNISDRTLAKYEKGYNSPTPQMLSLLADTLNFPEKFFNLDDIAELDSEGVSFRSLARTPVAVRNAAIGAGQIALEFSSWLEKNFSLPEVNLPNLSDLTPEAAAEAVRYNWGIGELPIQNMVHLLESKGILVFSLCEKTHDLDAYSFWMEERPYVFLNTQKSVERSRFDAAHELGHLLMHKHGGNIGKEAEFQANRFASAFLMPPNSIIAYSSPNITLNTIYEHKKYWKVSASALIKRLYDSHVISEWYYRSMMIELSKRGELKTEPHPIIARETSNLLSQIFKILRQEGKSKEDCAKDLCVFSEEINSLLFGLTIVGINGCNKNSKNASVRSKTNTLRRIK